MTYIESVNELNKIEKKYDVMAIKCKQVSVWPFLRIYLFQSFRESPNHHEMSSSNIMTVIKGLFAYNPFLFFKKYNIWLFNATERRKEIGNYFIHRVSGGVSIIEPGTLTIEKNGAKTPHYCHQNIEEKNIISESYLLFGAHLFEHLLRSKKIKIEGREVINKIINEYNIQFNYEYFIRYLIAQKKIIDILLFFTHNPQKVIIECPYNIMGYVWSFKDHGIPVIEMQHGVLNKNHYAYNSIFLSRELHPDKICVYGDDEYKYFMETETNYCKKINKTGLYILERSKKFFNKDVFAEYRREYESIIVCSGQADSEENMINFVQKIAIIKPSVLFVYIPRYSLEINPFNHRNILYKTNINIYEYLKWCDIHCTISSSTCLEAHYFHKPNIFFNYNNLSLEYYSNILNYDNGAVYINNADYFSDAYQKVLNRNFYYREIFTSDCIERLKSALK